MQLSGFAAGPYNTNTYVMRSETHAVVVDPGIHTEQPINKFLADHSLELEAIILTHGHLDHSRDAGDLARRHNAPVYIHEDDAFMLDKGAGIAPETRGLFGADNMLPVDDLRFFEDGATLNFAGEDFRIAHAPGHSPGSTLIIGQSFAFVGDVIFRGSIGRTDFANSDPEAMTRTLSGPVWQLDDALTLLPGHGPTTTMRVERTSNPFLVQLGLH